MSLIVSLTKWDHAAQPKSCRSTENGFSVTAAAINSATNWSFKCQYTSGNSSRGAAAGKGVARLAEYENAPEAITNQTPDFQPPQLTEKETGVTRR